MGVLIDSSVLVAAERGTLDLEGILKESGTEEAAISAITASELLHGVHRVRSAVGRARAQSFVDHLLSRIPVFPFDLDVARVHAMLSAELRTRGAAVGAHDLMIAATAVHVGFSVATRDLRSFPRIRELSVTRW